MVNSDQFKVEFKLNPGDMICMDNRRILHGRTRFSETRGVAEGHEDVILERDELQSALRGGERDVDGTNSNNWYGCHWYRLGSKIAGKWTPS